MSAATLVWLAVIATGSQLLACLFMDRLQRRRETWSRRQAVRWELSAEVQQIQVQRIKREAEAAAESTRDFMMTWLAEQRDARS